MLLGKVFKNINQKYKSIKFKNIRFNSKDCKYNDIFFAINGINSNGNNYINDAIRNGAKIIVSNLKFEGLNNNKILFIYNKNPRKLLSKVASRYYKLKPRNLNKLNNFQLLEEYKKIFLNSVSKNQIWGKFKPIKTNIKSYNIC